MTPGNYSLIGMLLAPFREAQQIGDDTMAGLRVSTIYAHDIELYETAIQDANHCHPVERYDDLEKAKEGHQKWLKKLPKLKTITKLGYGDLLEDTEITLESFDGAQGRRF